MTVRRVLGFVAALIAFPGYADPPGVYAITNGTIHPVSGPDIANGLVIVRDGLIESVGASVAIPPDATVIDAKKGHVYPGLIDAQTSLGFTLAAPTPRRGAARASAAPVPAAAPLETGPAFDSLREMKVSDEDLSSRRATGVTTLLAVPSSGIFNGQSVLMDLGDGSVGSRTIRAHATQQISFNRRPAWTYPDSLMGVISYIRQTLLDAQHDSAAHLIYEKNPVGFRRPEERADLQALAPALRREVPVVFVADTELMMRRAMTIAREFNLRPILSGAQQAYRMADELKSSGTPALVSVKWPLPPAGKDEAEDQPLRLIRDRQLALTTPAVLASRGVLFALVSAGAKSADFIPGVRKAIDNGLSVENALRATTLSPARILGIDRQVGSIDKGKIANLVMTDQPIFSKEARVTRVLIEGREVQLPSAEESQAKAKRAAGAQPAAETAGEKGPLDGSWSLTIKTNEGDVSIVASLHVENGQVSGSYSGDRGSGDIRGGRFDGTTVEFTISARLQAETSDWAFHGTLNGGSMTGTASGTGGTFPFSGSRSR